MEGVYDPQLGFFIIRRMKELESTFKDKLQWKIFKNKHCLYVRVQIGEYKRFEKITHESHYYDTIGHDLEQE